MVSWYGAQIFTHVETLYIFLCGVVGSSARIKVPKDRGMTYSCSSYLVTEVTRPCVGRDPVRISDHLSRGALMWQWEVPWPDHLLEIQRNNTRSVRF